VNADCRSQDARGRVGGGWGVPTRGLTRPDVLAQNSDADRGGNPSRRQSQDGKSTSTTDNGATVFRPAAGSKPVFSQQGGPRPRQPHKLVAGGFNSRPCSQPFRSLCQPDVLCASCRCVAGSGPSTPFLSSTPDCASGWFSPGLSARFVVWFVGVEVSLQRCWRRAFDLGRCSRGAHSRPNREFDSPDRCQFARRFTPVSGHHFGRECVYAGRRAFLSVVVPADVAAATLGVCVATTDCAGIAHRDAGALLFPGSRPGQIGTTWRKSRTNERSRKCRECRQPQPSPSKPTSLSLPTPGQGPRFTRGKLWKTVIRSSCPRRPRSSSNRLRALLGSGTGSRPALLTPWKAVCLVCGVGESRVGESTGLPRFTAWGALSDHCRCRPWQYAGRRLSPPLRAGRSVKKVGANRSPLMTPARRGWSMNRGLPTVTARVSSRLDLFPKVLGCFANDRPTVKTGWKTRTEYFFR